MVAKADADRAPNPIDVHVGLQVRFRRKALRMSQERLADALGLTFQQVQKYERGANRISASKLYEIARALKAPVGWFFEGLADPTEEAGDGDPGLPSHARDFLLSPEGLDLAGLFARLPQRRVRRRLIELIRSLVDAGEADAFGEAES
ncbi:MAG TPA: helix-turn-helix transcriptional regulator [Caulobacteraceae bacterium]|jgi:transcriptional regulator with XRE-family HTH domain|nr:helix-turn-helix transcriptional regulator [Caulobacteraceae bacterium]